MRYLYRGTYFHCISRCEHGHAVRYIVRADTLAVIEEDGFFPFSVLDAIDRARALDALACQQAALRNRAA